MCQQANTIAAAAAANNNKKMKPTYSIKKVLKTLFKKSQQQKISNSVESFESLDNLRNSEMEQQHFYEEIEDNSANEKLVVMSNTTVEYDEQVEEDIYVPVRFARTQAGTFFWTTNLQPVTSSIAPMVDEDLLQPAYCYSNYQQPYQCQFQDRWAQA